MESGRGQRVGVEFGVRVELGRIGQRRSVGIDGDHGDGRGHGGPGGDLLEGNRTKRINIASGAVTEYVWDHRNRLVEVIDRSSDGGAIVQSVEYVYDSQNRWIGKSIDRDGDGSEGSSDTYFVYDGNQIVLQVDGAGEVSNRYLWGPAVDQILADEQVQADGSTRVFSALTDHLNTVHDLVVYDPDTDLTTIANHLVFDAYGRITGETDPSVRSLFGFTARPFDADTGLQNNLNRWYDADVGRWMSEDPIGFNSADANLYRYCDGSPVNEVDPSGLQGAPPTTMPNPGFWSEVGAAWAEVAAAAAKAKDMALSAAKAVPSKVVASGAGFGTFITVVLWENTAGGPGDEITRADRLQWEIDALEDQIADLRDEIESKLDDDYGYGKHDVSGSLQYLRELAKRLADLKTQQLGGG